MTVHRCPLGASELIGLAGNWLGLSIKSAAAIFAPPSLVALCSTGMGAGQAVARPVGVMGGILSAQEIAAVDGQTD